MIESALRAAELLATPRVAPSILAADFGRLAAQVEEVMEAGARVIHVDVMDGHFVPPITIGALVVDALKEPVARRGGILDVHLMIERPERRAAEFARAGADVITIHLEATPHAHRALSTVREAASRSSPARSRSCVACATSPAQGSCSRSTAAWPRTTPTPAARRGQPCSWPARPSSPPRTRLRPTRRSRRRRAPRRVERPC